MGTEMRLSESIMDSEVSLNQPEDLIEKMSLELESNQQMQLTKEEDQRSLLMIGGIGIFLPLSLEEAKVYVADEEETIRERQLAKIVKQELEQVFETAQAEEEENEHSEEWLNTFSQVAERTATWEFAKKKKK
jgi:hypothetical protein